jgi:hypothetical protein
VAVPGAIICWWFRSYTDWFGGVLTGLGLGGAVWWAGIVWGLIGDERQKDVGARLVAPLDGRWPARVALLLVAVLFLLSLFWGAVRVENVQGPDAAVQVYRGPKPEPGEDERLVAGAERNWPWLMWPWGSATVHVKVAGLPARDVTVRPWWRGPEKVQVPGSFLRPVVLIGAPSFDIVDADKDSQELRITVDGAACPPVPYDGRAILLGTSEADADLPLPAGLSSRNGWDAVLGKPRAAARFLPPLTGVGPPYLKPGSRVSVQLVETKGCGRILAESPQVMLPHPTDRGDIMAPVLLTSP